MTGNYSYAILKAYCSSEEVGILELLKKQRSPPAGGKMGGTAGYKLVPNDYRLVIRDEFFIAYEKHEQFAKIAKIKKNYARKQYNGKNCSAL